MYVVRSVRLYVSSQRLHSSGCCCWVPFANCTARDVLWVVLCRIAQLGISFFAELHSSVCSRELCISVATPSDCSSAWTAISLSSRLASKTVVRGIGTKFDNYLETQPLELQVMVLLVENTCDFGQRTAGWAFHRSLPVRP